MQKDIGSMYEQEIAEELVAAHVVDGDLLLLLEIRSGLQRKTRQGQRGLYNGRTGPVCMQGGKLRQQRLHVYRSPQSTARDPGL